VRTFVTFLSYFFTEGARLLRGTSCRSVSNSAFKDKPILLEINVLFLLYGSVEKIAFFDASGLYALNRQQEILNRILFIFSDL